MKIYTLILFGFILSINSFSQNLEKGNILIDPYYGGPNFGKALAKLIQSKLDFDIEGSKGPFGLRAEYMLTDKMSVGLDYIYNDFSLSAQFDSLNADQTLFRSYKVDARVSRNRILGKFNYHFVNHDHFNMYIGGGIGLNFRKVTLSTDLSDFDDFSLKGALSPIAGRVALGMRYYFVNHIGLSAELGLGGPVVSAGLCLKF